MKKDPICIEPADSGITMHEASRINFANPSPVDWNVKANDIGEVYPPDRIKLVRYYEEIFTEDELDPDQACARQQNLQEF